ANPRHPTRFTDAPLLTREQEQALFQRYNYLKYRIAKLKEGLRLVRPRASLIAQIEALRKSACEVKNQIVQSNLRLVVSVAKRHVGRSATLADLVSDGNFCLMRAVETFDFTRGNRFSTYATWALIKHYARTVPEENYVLDRFVTGREEVLEQAGAPAEDLLERSDLLRVLGDAVGRILTRLSERERSIIVARFGIGGESEPQTLEQVGRAFGLTRERIRQIEAGALRKLREFLRAEPALEASL
ncbi:MAG: sigma-70 family RNA polymerase sigma factor, partial [Planctomycetes bacterium]|nr:sigma-70 family RNA polymerase sigma factor [Planctomycetota bacterium]